MLDLFNARPGELTDLGTLEDAQRVYPRPDADRFPLFYPYLPWTVAVIPDVVKGIAQAAGREEALTGSNRTMIGVVQGAIIETPGLLDSPLGRLLSLGRPVSPAGQRRADRDEDRPEQHPRQRTGGEPADHPRGPGPVPARPGQAYPDHGRQRGARPRRHPRCRPGAGRKAIKAELDRLVGAGYAKPVGEQYVFLNTQQRSFQDRVRARQDELMGQTYELSQALKEYESEDALRFDKIPLQGREITLKLELDGRIVRNPAAPVTLRVSSPLQRTLDPDLADDTVLKARANGEPDAILFRLADVPELRRVLALAVATGEIASQVTSAGTGGPEIEVARTARQIDLPSHKADVRRLLGQAVRGGVLFFRGTTYNLAGGDSPSSAVRATLAQILPLIYPRLADMPHRIANEEAAVKAALAGNTSNVDLQTLGVYKADGSLNEANALLSELRGRLPIGNGSQGPLAVDSLRTTLERPPFGWDPNGVKVGLALLLRNSACVLIEGGLKLTDPSSPEVLGRSPRRRASRACGSKGSRPT